MRKYSWLLFTQCLQTTENLIHLKPSYDFLTNSKPKKFKNHTAFICQK